MSRKSYNKCKTKFCRNPRQDGCLCYKCRKRLYRERNPAKDAYNNLRNSAKRRGIEFSITFEYFKEFAAKYDYINKRGQSATALTVDRKKPHLGYVVGNLSVITNSENVAKGNRERALDYVWKKICGYKDNEPF